MRQVKPGDMAVVVGVRNPIDSIWLGEMVTAVKWIKPGDTVPGNGFFCPVEPEKGPFMECKGRGVTISIRASFLMPIDPDETITQEQDEEVTA